MWWCLDSFWNCNSLLCTTAIIYISCTPSSLTFINSQVCPLILPSFLMFGRLWGPRSIDSLEGPLTRKQVFPIILSGIELIPTSTITLIIYLKNWAFVASIIVVRFMVNQRPFFLALVWVNNNTFPFQQHLKATRNLLLPPTFLPFE